MKVVYNKKSENILNDLKWILWNKTIPILQTLPEGLKEEDVIRKYKNSRESAEEYVDFIVKDFENKLTSLSDIRYVNPQKEWGKCSYELFVKRGKGWHFIFKKYKEYYRVIDIISVSRLKEPAVCLFSRRAYTKT